MQRIQIRPTAMLMLSFRTVLTSVELFAVIHCNKDVGL